MKVFSSGSCRLLTALQNGRGKIEPIHSIICNITGINTLGMLHNIKQHIQFIKWLKHDLYIPESILSLFLLSYRTPDQRDKMDPYEQNPIKKKAIQDSFDDCEFYIFEICSLKIYEKNGYQILYLYDTLEDCTQSIQTELELYNDLKILRELIPNKKIIFQVHFRPNIIYNNESNAVNNRESIYNAVEKFCKEFNNTYLYDPSIILQKNNTLFDGDTHFTERGEEESFNFLYNNFITLT